jgi:hypothetical protein
VAEHDDLQHLNAERAAVHSALGFPDSPQVNGVHGPSGMLQASHEPRPQKQIALMPEAGSQVVTNGSQDGLPQLLTALLAGLEQLSNRLEAVERAVRDIGIQIRD